MLNELYIEAYLRHAEAKARLEAIKELRAESEETLKSEPSTEEEMPKKSVDEEPNPTKEKVTKRKPKPVEEETVTEEEFEKATQPMTRLRLLTKIKNDWLNSHPDFRERMEQTFQKLYGGSKVASVPEDKYQEAYDALEKVYNELQEEQA